MLESQFSSRELTEFTEIAKQRGGLIAANIRVATKVRRRCYHDVLEIDNERLLLVREFLELEEIVAKQAAIIRRYQELEDSRIQQMSRQARFDADYLGYHEDEYNR